MPPVVPLVRIGTWTQLRRVALAPQIFQLRASNRYIKSSPPSQQFEKTSKPPISHAEKPEHTPFVTEQVPYQGQARRPEHHTPKVPSESTSQTTALNTSLRQHLRRVPQSVAVTLAPLVSSPSSKAPPHYHGATISSFTCVSLSPSPIISFNLKLPSSTFSSIESSTQSHFSIDFLEATARGAATARHYTRPRTTNNRSLESPGGKVARQDLSRSPAEQTETEADAGQSDKPLTPRLRASSFRLMCQYKPDLTVRIQDHVVVFAEVLDVLDTRAAGADNRVSSGPDVDADLNADAVPCLGYWQSGYASMKRIEMEREREKEGG